MRIRETIVAAGLLSIFGGVLLTPSEAAAQAVPARVERDANWDLVSNVTMLVGVGVVTLMPRVFYNDPEATVGWKARWHVSMLAPALSMTALTLLMDGPIRNGIKGNRPGCPPDWSAARLPGSGCESYGMVSTQSFAAWGATGAGTGIFLVDTIKYSGGRFNAGAFVGNVAVPLVLSVITSAARSAEPDSNGLTVFPHEDPGQIALGALTGFATGAILGLAYTMFQRPNCGYGNKIFCW